ncbi:ABC transporter permease [Brevundimonas aurifodinae]|uniref:ABC transporter permease n=2 Tax=Brevundimonas TaxID=41275 RepID=A0ABV1NL96_9CAUL|nr:MAG: ABC transporter permease [Brevundimonas sp. 12-68-7]OYX32770.1 MAG: ABC transporter permease [Brevundimonas subvibrioides]
MNRILLIARREFMAYARTVGFWLSLLAFPLFAVLGGAIPILMDSADEVRAVVLIEEGPQAAGLAQAVQGRLADEAERSAQRAREAAQQAAEATGMPPEATQNAVAQAARQRMQIVDTPADLAQATPGEARDALVRRYLTDETPEDQRLDAVVFLDRAAEGPSARVWAARATDDTVEDFVRAALRDANRDQVLTQAGIDPAVVEATDAFRPEVTLFSPRASDGGEVSFKDRLPGIIGLAFAFILWSLIITGASILLNSVMEEKSNKILEVLLSSASATEILTGKVLGVAMLTLSVLLVWGGIGAIGLVSAVPEQAVNIWEILTANGLIFYFLGYIVGGYLMYAVLFAAIGAFCETPRDAQTLMGPIMMVLVIPILLVQFALVNPDAPLVRFASWVPFFTPFLMAARAPSGPPLIEVIGTMAGMFAVALLMVWLAGRAFRAGALSDVKLSWKSFGQAIAGGGR